MNSFFSDFSEKREIASIGTCPLLSDCIRNRNVRHRLDAWLKVQGIALDSDEAAAHHRRVAQILLKAHAVAPEALIEQVGAEITCKGAKRKGSKEQRHRAFVIPGLGLCAIGGRVRQ